MWCCCWPQKTPKEDLYERVARLNVEEKQSERLKRLDRLTKRALRAFQKVELL